jgi:hypothetical protein
MMAFCAGRHGVTAIEFFSLESAYGTLSHLFQDTLGSFKYLPGYDYQEGQTTSPVGSSWNIQGAISKGIAFAIIAALWALINKRKKSSA